MMLPTKALALMGSSLALAGGAGVFAAQALTGSSAAPQPSKTVTLSLTNGAQGPTGPAGPAGHSITIKGSVPTPGDLPTTGNQPGDTYIVSSDGSMRTWDGDKFVSSGPITGGQEGCPAGYTFGKLVIDHPGGHVSIATCIED